MVLLDVDVMCNSKIPDIDSQKTQIEDKLREPMLVGETWYLIEAKWFKTFKYFVGIENPERCSNAINPGPIDNSLLIDILAGYMSPGDYNDLFKGFSPPSRAKLNFFRCSMNVNKVYLYEVGVPMCLDLNCTKLKRNLVENLDFVVLPASAWSLLMNWYGMKDQQKPIARKVINIARPPKVDPRLEIYEIELNLYDNSEFSNPLTYSFSNADPISRIEAVCRKIFKVPEEAQIQLRCFYGGPQLSQILHPDYTVYEESLNHDLKIVMEVLPPEQIAPEKASFTRPLVRRNREPSRIPRVAGPGVVTRHSSNLGAGSLGSAEGRGQPCTPGLSGLMNLGNTCFLNSIIQCLSNCGPVTQYFLDGNHEREINATNPLGRAGQIANSFADVIKMMWSGRHAITVPHCFKLQLTKFAPQFAGCQQHDAQELLTFLLDGLHEDLNRVKNKPYQQTEEGDSDDDALAESSWDYFKSRNNSIIIDNFHGMLKSRVVCPDCEKVSVKFDTFSTLSLPLSLRCDRTILVRWVPYDQSQNVIDLTVVVPKKGTIQDLAIELGNATCVNPEHIIITEINRSHFHRFFSMDDPIETIEDQDKIFMYDLPADMVRDESCKYTILPIVLWEVQDPSRNAHFLSSLFGTPFLLYLPRGQMYFKQLYDSICERMTRNCEGFMNANTNFGSLLMDYEPACDDSNKNETSSPYLFSPILVNTFCYDEIKKLEDNNEALFEIPESFGRELLALQITWEVRQQYYREAPVVQAPRSSAPLRPNPRPSLLDCLNLFITTEKLGESNAWHCPQCNKKKRATKKLDLWKLPKILIFHLKRFAFNEIRKEKLDMKVEFPLTGLNLDDIVMNKHKENLEYDLIGVCNHYGSLMGGHYTAHCKSYHDGQWYCYDDNTVTPVSPESVQSESAYMLFYQRRPDPAMESASAGEKIDI